jgi:hypothetical protein
LLVFANCAHLKHGDRPGNFDNLQKSSAIIQAENIENVEERGSMVLILRVAIIPLVALSFGSNSYADTVGNIVCGAENSLGERVVCDYVIIGNKYQRLFDTRFSDGRDAAITLEVKEKVAACDSLSCVEKIIDEELAVSSAEANRPASPENSTNAKHADSHTLATGLASPGSEEVSKSTPSKKVTIDEILVYLFLIFGILWLVFHRRVKPSKKGKGRNSRIGGTLFVLDASSKPASPMNVAIRPNSGVGSAYQWDGRVLRSPDGRSETSWEFDGRNLKPYGGTYGAGYEWDGVRLRPNNGESLGGFEWDGRILKPYKGSNSDGFELEGKVMKPCYGAYSDGWEASEPIPIPVWALVLGAVKN